jgi:hypothetical protein
MRGTSRRLAAVGIAAAVIVASASAAYAAITSPTGNPFVVPNDGTGNPAPFSISASGFTANQPVFIEECDGRTPNVGTWDVSIDCDPGDTTPPHNADASGNVTFGVGTDFQFTAFKGESPSSQFNCLSPNEAPLNPTNFLTDYRNCQIRVSSNNASKTGDESYLRIQLPDGPNDTTTTTTTTTVPGGPTKTTLGTCTGLNAVATIKNTVTGAGLTNTLPPTGQSDKISVKSINAPACSGPSFTAPGTAIDSASLKASIVGAESCNTSLPPSFPPNGKLGFTQGVGTVKDGGYVRFSANDPTKNYFADVVSVHGIMVKGPLAGVDLDGTLSQDPTVKDKTVPAVQYGAFTGLDVNPFDSAMIGASCLSGTSSGNLLFNDNLSGGTKPVAVPTAITTTLVGDGSSLLDGAGLAPPADHTHPGVPAAGLTFSVY